MKKIVISLLLVLCLAATVLGGCSSGDTNTDKEKITDNNDTTKDNTSDDKVSKDTPTEVKIWTWSPISRTMDKMIKAFNENNPDIKVTYTNYNFSPEYLSALAAGAGSNSLPDIIGLQPGSFTQQYKEYLINLGSYAENSWGENWENNFYKINSNQIQLGNAEGDNNKYIMPCESQIINIWYNTRIFDELDLSVPKTWDELKSVSKKLTDNGYAPLYFGGADGWQHVNVFQMLAHQMVPIDKVQDGTVKWTDPKMLKAMEAFKDMFDSGIMQVGSLSNHAYPDGVNLFTAGKVGMMALGSWWLQEYTAPKRVGAVENWDFDNFYLPSYEDGGQVSPPVGGIDFGYGITKDCKNPEAAWRVIEAFSAGVGIQAAINDLNNLPAYKGIIPEGDIPEKVKDQSMTYAELLDSAYNQRIGEPSIENALQNALSGVAAGQLSPMEALEAIQEEQDKVSNK